MAVDHDRLFKDPSLFPMILLCLSLVDHISNKSFEDKMMHSLQ